MTPYEKYQDIDGILLPELHRSEMECGDMPIKYEINQNICAKHSPYRWVSRLDTEKNVKKINLLTLFPHSLEQHALVTF